MQKEEKEKQEKEKAQKQLEQGAENLLISAPWWAKTKPSWQQFTRCRLLPLKKTLLLLKTNLMLSAYACVPAQSVARNALRLALRRY